MKIIFEESENKNITFGDVSENQFFVCTDNILWQKVGTRTANQITSPDGTPYADASDSWDTLDQISKIIPTISKIEY